MAKRALVIEDDGNIAELLRLYLGKDGFEVMLCADGAKAEASFDLFAPDVVLLDIMLPGMDGIEILKKLRSCPATAGIPVIIVDRMIEVSDMGMHTANACRRILPDDERTPRCFLRNQSRSPAVRKEFSCWLPEN